jgi:hypothetical protein
MADVDLRTTGGDPVRLRDGSTATLEYVLPDSLQAEYSDGDTIEAFFFEEEQGVWMQEGNGTVGTSTYAADRLSWTLDVEHFSWWNADKPWTDKNCVEVTVTTTGGMPVANAQVHAKGLSYNGITTATTNAAGMACLDFKRNGTVEVYATPPQGFFQAGPPKTVTGTMAAAACSGQGENCQSVSLELTPGHCIRGTVVDGMGNPVSGATVTGTYSTPDGKGNSRATTGPDGRYCLTVPSDAEVDISVVEASGNQVLTGDGTVTAGSGAAACSGDMCTPGGEITITPSGDSGCVTGSVETESSNMMGAVPAKGTPVYIFAGDAQVDCTNAPNDPSQWGQLIGQTTTGASGNFCLEVPITSTDVTVITGNCDANLGSECLGGFQKTSGPMQAATCGGGSCVQFSQTIFNPRCGTGP